MKKKENDGTPVEPKMLGDHKKSALRASAADLQVGMRASVDDHMGHIASKVGIDLSELAAYSVETKPSDELVLKAIIAHGMGPKKSFLERQYSQIKRFIDGRMKFHKELVEHGSSGVHAHRWPCLRRIVVHSAFETCMAALIIANCVIIGWQAQLRNPEGTTKIINTIIEHLFTSLFSAELVLRAIVFNWTFWFDRDNWLDIFLVILSVLNSWILTPIGIKADFMRKATVLRILRLVRIARNFKRQFKEMWQLLRGLFDSFETLLWTYVMMLCVLYFFAISATTLFAKIGAYESDEIANEIAQEHFSDVVASMFTLFQIMTLDSWSSIMRPLMKVQVWAVFFFILFITVSVFLMMNLITSVIVTETFKHGQADKAEQAAEKEAEQDKARKELVQVFAEMDADGGGTLSQQEVAQAWKNRRVRQKFRTMDIGKKDLGILWTALDDGDGELTIDEFINGMRKLKGEARAKDILKLYREVRILESSIKEITILSDYSKERMNNIRMKLRTTFRELDATRRTLGRVKETARLAAKTQPLCV